MGVLRGFWGEIHRRGAEIAEVSQRFNREDAKTLRDARISCIIHPLWQKNSPRRSRDSGVYAET